MVVLGHAILAFWLSLLPLPSLLLDNFPDPLLDRVVYLLTPLILGYLCLSAQPKDVRTDLAPHLFLGNGVEAHTAELVDRVPQHLSVKSKSTFTLDLIFIFGLGNYIFHFNRIKSF